MGTEAEARAVGAGVPVEINGIEYRLSPISIRSLCELEREALRYYKNQYLRTFIDSAELVDGGDDLISKKMEEVARWELDDLPKKDVYDVSSVPVTKKARNWAKQFREDATTDEQVLAILQHALHEGMLTSDEVTKLTGKKPAMLSVRYDQWWTTGTTEGKSALVRASLRKEHGDVSKEEVQAWSNVNLIKVANLAEQLTAASVGNS